MVECEGLRLGAALPSHSHMAKYTEEWVANGDTKFYTRIYSAPKPKAAVVFVHGFIEHIARCASLPTSNSRATL